MKHILLAPAFVIVSVAAVSAQPAAPAPSALPAAPAPHVSLPPTMQDLLVDALAQSPFDHQLFERTTQRTVEKMLTLAQQAKPFKAVTVVEPLSPFKGEPGSVEAWYSQARSFIERDQYDRSIAPLDRVIDARSNRADAAMYWKAYSLWKLAQRDDALSTLSQLQKQYAESRWIRDARALEVEVKQAAGQTVETSNADDDVKLLALQGIMRTDPETALPVVEKMLAGTGSVRLKERALFVLSQNRSDRAREIIGNVAKGGSNPDLQLLAIRYLGMSSSPEAAVTLSSVYRGDASVDMRRAVISALASTHNPAASNALVTLARGERNPELKTLMVRHLSMSSTPEAKAYMLELLR